MATVKTFSFRPVEGSTVWLIGRWLSGRSPCDNPRLSGEWEARGLEASEAKAVARCTESGDFIAPLVVGAAIPDEAQVFPGAYYPLAEGDSTKRKAGP